MSKGWTQPSLLIYTLLLMLLCIGCQSESEYPNKPILIICPWATGGGTDRLSRQLAIQLEQELEVPVNVINATGGSGVVGHARGARAKPDGYTLAMTTVELNMLHWRGMTDLTYRDFEPLMLLNKDSAALFVRADSPWTDLRALQKELQDREQPLKATGTAQGGIWHLSLLGWLDAAGIPPNATLWVSINGAGPSLQELLSGRVDLVCCSLPEAAALLRTNEIRCLGVMADEGLAAFPNVETFRDQGIDWSSGGWRALGLPQGVPEDRVELLRATFERIVESDRYRQFMEENGFNISEASLAAWSEELVRLDEQFGIIMTGEVFQSAQEVAYGPYVFPTILALLCSIALVALIGSRKMKGSAPKNPRDNRNLLFPVGCILGLCCYGLVLETLGFIIASIAFMFLMLKILDAGWSRSFLIPLIVVPTAYQVFSVFLRVPLPRGFWGW